MRAPARHRLAWFEGKTRPGFSRPQPLCYAVVRGLSRFLSWAFFGLRCEIDPAIERLEGPVVLLSNHQSNVDPMLAVAAYPKRPLNFLTGDFMLEIKGIQWILSAMRVIPKAQFATDSRAVRLTLRTLKDHGVVVIYPEGQRSYHGGPMPPVAGACRLAKKAKAHLVVIQQQGAYFAWPRWTTFFRPGPVSLRLRLLYRAEDWEQVSEDAAEAAVRQAMGQGDYAWQAKRTKKARYLAWAPASGLASFLHRCPRCTLPMVLKDQGALLRCGACAAQFRLGRDMYFRAADGGSLPFDRIDTWHAWQQEMEAKDVQSAEAKGLPWLDFPVEMRWGYGQRHEAPQKARGRIRCDAKALHFVPDPGTEAEPWSSPFQKGRMLSLATGMYFSLPCANALLHFYPDAPVYGMRLADWLLYAYG